MDADNQLVFLSIVHSIRHLSDKNKKKHYNMAEQKKDGRGSGSKLNVGRKKLTYETKTVYKKVPESIHDLCCSLVDAEVLKYKLKNK